MVSTPTTFAGLVALFIDFISLLIPLIFGITLLFIAWKLFDAWIFNGGDAGKVSEGRQVAFTGAIVLVVMSGVWGILQILRNGLFDI